MGASPHRLERKNRCVTKLFCSETKHTLTNRSRTNMYYKNRYNLPFRNKKLFWNGIYCIISDGRRLFRACACRTGGKSVLPAGHEERIGSVRHSLRSTRRDWLAQTSWRVSARARLLRRTGVQASRSEAAALAGIRVAQDGSHPSGLPRTALRAVEGPHGVHGGHAPQPRAAAGDGLRVGPGDYGG